MIMTPIARGIALQQEGALDQAEACYRQALAIAPNQPDAHNYLGLIHLSRGEHDEAGRLMDRSLELVPGNATYWVNRSALYREQQLWPAAEAALWRAIELAPEAPGHKLLLADLLRREKRSAEAREQLDAAEALEPGLPGLALQQGALAAEQRRFKDALPYFERAVEQHPRAVDAWLGLANTHKALEHEPEAREAVERAATLAPDAYPVVQLQAGVAGHFWHFEEAERHYRRAIQLCPELPDAYANMSVLYGDRQDLAGVERCIAQATERQENKDAYGLNLGMAYLQHADFTRGWAHYEQREYPKPPVWYPLWQGEDLAGKRILLVGEQGAGDHMQFGRFISHVAALGATVDMLTSENLVPLFQTVRGVNEVSAVLPTADYDYWAPLMSVPHRLGLGLEDFTRHGSPVMSVDQARIDHWRGRLDALARPGTRRVGLVWAGNPEHMRDGVRSMHLQDLAPLADVEGVTFFSLQKGYAEAQLADAPFDIVPLGHEFQDFADTGAAMHGLDLVLTVDTSVSHLAGSLGIPVWVMLCAVPDWRWLLDRSDCPWYPSARLFRQETPMQWQGVVAEVAEALTLG